MSDILIVEDHAMSRQMLKTILTHAGHHVTEAADGSAALTLARSQNPDLIVSDIAMPTMDGIEFVRRLRSEQAAKITPVIFYTATYRVPDVGPLVKTFAQCRVLPKPSGRSLILETVNEMLGKPSPEPASKLKTDTPVPDIVKSDANQHGAGLQLATLVDLSYHLVGQRDPVRLLYSYCRAAREIAQCKEAFLALVDQDQTRFFCGSDGLEAPKIQGLLPILEIHDRVFVKRGTYRQHHRSGASRDGQEYSYKSLLAVPFSTANRVYGWTCFIDKLDGSPFTDEDEELDVALNSQAALAYENLLIVEELKKTRKELEHRVKDLEGVVAERQRMEAALKDSEKTYRSLVDHALVGVFRADLEGRFLYVNDTMAGILACKSTKEALSHNILTRARTSQHQEAFVEKLKREGSVRNYALEVPAGAGGLKHVLVGATVSDGALSGMMLDITEQKLLEEQLRQAQKMEAVGQLAGGVAHDFNNILSAIIGYGSLLRLKMDPANPSKHVVDQILESADRAASLTHSLLAFSRKQILIPQALNINDIIRKVATFLKRILGEDIELTATFKGGELFSVVDGGQMEQVLMNLATNARDAMPRGGRLSLSVEPREIDQAFVQANGYGEPGSYVLVSVTDTGMGMDEQTQKRIFEPFFTTKEMGKGTGLGLAMVYGIVKQHDGIITVSSEPGDGTTFKIYLKRIAVTAEEAREASVPPDPQGGKETVLIAEDDKQLRDLMELVLKEYGYTVLAAQDGEDAVRQVVRHKDGIRLAILDMIMPKMGGSDAYREIRKIKPGIKTIIQTGYTADRMFQEGRFQEEVDFILKPISPRDLLLKVREVLDR